MRSFPVIAVLSLLSLTSVGCASRVRLEMGGLTEAAVEPMARNAVGMQCQLRRGIGRVALRCPGVAHPEETLDMVIWNTGRVECVARRDREDDCPLVAEALLRD